MLPHPLTNFETQNFYQHESQFNGVYSRNNLPKVKNGINLHKFKSIKTHWIASYVNGNSAIYFDSLWVEHIPRKNKKVIRDKNIITNIYRIQVYGSTMFGYFCVGFIEFILKGKSC